MDTKKLLIWIASFVLFTGLGFGGVKLVSALLNGQRNSDVAEPGVSIVKVDPEERYPVKEVVPSRRDSISEPDSVAVLPDGNTINNMIDEVDKKEKEGLDKANRMSASTFQALMLNQNDTSVLGGKHPQVAKRISVHVVGMRDGERRPDDILAIRNKIAYGQWVSATVVNVGYDSLGRINSVTVRPVYSSNENSSEEF